MNIEEYQTPLLEQMLLLANIKPTDSDYSITKRGVVSFIENIISQEIPIEKINRTLVDQMLVEIDNKLSMQVNTILHANPYQRLESAWRSLDILVKRVDFRENIKIEILSISKQALLDDFNNAVEINQSGLYQQVYAKGYGQFGGEPTGVIIGNYNFDNSNADISLLKQIASVSAMAHAPFISAVDANFFGLKSFTDLTNIKDLKSLIESPKFIGWNSLRMHPDARYIGLTMPRFLLRTPYDKNNQYQCKFNYSEKLDNKHTNYLWGNTAFLFATCLADSFAKYRWCPNIIGPQSGGGVKDLPIHLFHAMGELQAKIPTEILITDRSEYELAEHGFIPLTLRRGSDSATFFSANSIQKPKLFAATITGKQAQLNYRLGTQLPYLMIINRLAHYLKVLQREQIGAWKEKDDLERELNIWLRQYIADQENPPAKIRSRKPLRKAKVIVSEIEGEAGIYQVFLAIRPHFKYLGANFELSLIGILERA